jgi:hypothetical protein
MVGSIDILFLEKLYNGEIQSELERCGAIEISTEKAKFCRDFPQVLNS